MTIRQIVLLSFPEGTGTDTLERFSAGVQRLVEGSPDMLAASWGPDVGKEIGANQDNWSFVMAFDFADPEALARYKRHPTHLRFIDDHLRGRGVEVARIQYRLPGDGAARRGH